MKSTLIVVLLLVMTVNVCAQTVTYTYDNAGNRTARTVSTAAKSPQMIESQQAMTALPNLVAQRDISVYPNPTQGHFTVDIGNVYHENLLLKMNFKNDGNIRLTAYPIVSFKSNSKNICLIC